MLGREHGIGRQFLGHFDRDFVGHKNLVLVTHRIANNLVDLHTIKIITHAEAVFRSVKVFPLGHRIGGIDRTALGPLQNHQMLHLGDPAITDLFKPVTQRTAHTDNGAADIR